MKTNCIIKILTAALLLAAAPTGTHAASLLEDGDFDFLLVGTSPDYGTPAGHWEMSTWGPDTENAPSQISIAPAPAGGTGNALRFSLAEGDPPVRSPLVLNTLASPVTAVSGQILNVSFDIYVEPGAAAPSLYLSDGNDRRAAQLSWDSAGTLSDWGNSYPLTVVSPYPRGVWQTVRLELDAAHARYNFYWSEKGQPVSVTRSNLRFMNTNNLASINDLYVVRFWDWAAAPPAVRASLDNVRVTTDPVITPVALDLVTAGSTTLQLVNVQTNSNIQWQFNGTDIATATNASLELSGVTTNHSGSYRAVVTSGAAVLTTDPSNVRVFDQLTITTPPQSVTVVSGTPTGFSVAAAGPLPITYQWQRDGTNLVGKTTRFLTLGAALSLVGNYSVVVSDANGSVVSPPVTLTVLVPPVVSQGPLSQSVVAAAASPSARRSLPTVPPHSPTNGARALTSPTRRSWRMSLRRSAPPS